MQISRLAYSPLEGDGKVEPPPRSFLNRMIPGAGRARAIRVWARRHSDGPGVGARRNQADGIQTSIWASGPHGLSGSVPTSSDLTSIR